jgi:hypothetical protein
LSSVSFVSFLGVKEEVAPNPPAVVGAAHALEPELANPPNKGLEGVLSFGVSLLSEESVGVAAVNEPKIFVALSETVLTALAAASFTASRGVAASTWDGEAVEAVLSGLGVVSSTTGASLLTPDMMVRRRRRGRVSKLNADKSSRWSVSQTVVANERWPRLI